MEDLQGNNLDEFYKNYRETLGNVYDTTVQSLDQQRRNAQTSIMSAANKAGMMYSNFPARDKLKYDVGTYQPALIKAQQSYQTGLQTLRENALKTVNNIRNLQEQIQHLNELAAKKSTSSTSTAESVLEQQQAAAGI